MTNVKLLKENKSSCEKFAKIFNSCNANNLEIVPKLGIIRDRITGKYIKFDWQKRLRYFHNGKFKFGTLCQTEDKLHDPSIIVTLQCDTNDNGGESAVAVAFHSDYKASQKKSVIMDRLINGSWESREIDARYTQKFKIYAYNKEEDMTSLKNIIAEHMP